MHIPIEHSPPATIKADGRLVYNNYDASVKNDDFMLIILIERFLMLDTTLGSVLIRLRLIFITMAGNTRSVCW